MQRLWSESYLGVDADPWQKRSWFDHRAGLSSVASYRTRIATKLIAAFELSGLLTTVAEQTPRLSFGHLAVHIIMLIAQEK